MPTHGGRYKRTASQSPDGVAGATVTPDRFVRLAVSEIAGLIRLDLSGADWRVLLWLLEHCRANGYGGRDFTTYQGHIVQETGLSIATVKRSLVRLEHDYRLIEVEHHNGARCTYQVKTSLKSELGVVHGAGQTSLNSELGGSSILSYASNSTSLRSEPKYPTERKNEERRTERVAPGDLVPEDDDDHDDPMWDCPF